MKEKEHTDNKVIRESMNIESRKYQNLLEVEIMATGKEKDRNVAYDFTTGKSEHQTGNKPMNQSQEHTNKTKPTEHSKGHLTKQQDSKKENSEPISEHKPVYKTKHLEPAKSK